MNKVKIKTIIEILRVFLVSYILFALFEFIMLKIFNINFDKLEYGWLGYFGILLIYGFKYHIICCLIPLIYTTYVCRHKKCGHEHCKK
jgi:hypothetical protein